MGTLASDCHGESSSGPDQRQPDGGDQRADQHSDVEYDECHFLHGIGRLGRQQGAIGLAGHRPGHGHHDLHADVQQRQRKSQRGGHGSPADATGSDSHVQCEPNEHLERR